MFEPAADSSQDCDYLVTLLAHRNKLKNECRAKVAEINLKKAIKSDERKLRCKLNGRRVLREYIDGLNEKLKVLVKIMEDMGREYVQSQAENSKLENVLEVQQLAIEKVELKSKEIEAKVNDEITKARESFVTKWNDLKALREKFELAQEELQESRKKQNHLVIDLREAKESHRKHSCELKLLRQAAISKKLFTEEMFDKLRRKQEVLQKKLRQELSEVECFRQKLFQVQQEGEITRKVTRSELKVAKMHDEWNSEQLNKRKEKLEMMIEETLRSGDNHDKILMHLRRSVAMSEINIVESQGAIKNLQSLAEAVVSKQNICRNISTPVLETAKLKKIPIEEKEIIIARDYMGSTFIHLQ